MKMYEAPELLELGQAAALVLGIKTVAPTDFVDPDLREEASVADFDE
jgi:hypothetical protein